MKRLLCILFLLCLTVLSACKQAAPPSKFILNGFDTVQELYSIRPAIQLMDGSMDIVSTEKVKSGSGSALLIYQRGSKPYMILHIQQTAYPDLDLAAMDRMTLSVYNDNPQAASCQITLVGKDFSPLLTQDYPLQPGQWNTLELPLTDYDPTQALGFGFRLEAEENTRFYLDEWAVE